MAKRSSCAPAQSAVLPRREWAHDNHAACIDVLVGLEIKSRARMRPRPSTDRTPLRSGSRLLLAWIEEHVHAVGRAVGVVGK